jgi:hypothetical protein
VSLKTYQLLLIILTRNAFVNQRILKKDDLAIIKVIAAMFINQSHDHFVCEGVSDNRLAYGYHPLPTAH